MQRLDGKVAVVTGAGQGIGRAIAERFAEEGARVVVCDLNRDAAHEVAGAIGAGGGAASAIIADVGNAESVTALAAQTLDAYGRIDIVCNNAGVLDGFAPLLETSDDVWNRVIAVNLTGYFLVSRAFLPAMLRQAGGAFVNLASMAGIVAQAGGTAYTASKHGVIGLTRQVAADYGRQGIRANAICPGSIDTELSRNFLKDAPEVRAVVESVPAGRQGRPEEIAELAAFLASDGAGFIHGAAIMIDGGWTIR